MPTVRERREDLICTKRAGVAFPARRGNAKQIYKASAVLSFHLDRFVLIWIDLFCPDFGLICFVLALD